MRSSRSTRMHTLWPGEIVSSKALIGRGSPEVVGARAEYRASL
ncbi:hypothetical protein [Streptomyces sp. NPDC045369]